ncbi:Mss4-like protein [Xylariomycetidae sp. FL2044]|nr:Mss4-like protein [Xylariomycetidae sp. FL2044]
MPEGGCFCGKVRYAYEGEPIAKALCHCIDCRKITGSTYSTNIIVPGAHFRLLAGEPKSIAKVADTANEITSKFCGDCGSTLWRESATFGDGRVVKIGTLDDPDALDRLKPAVELYAPRRVGWVKEIEGAEQKQGMS